MNSENSKTSDLCRLMFNLPDKMNLKKSDKYLALSKHLLRMENIKKVI